MGKKYDEEESDNVIEGFTVVIRLLGLVAIIALLCGLIIEYAL